MRPVNFINSLAQNLVQCLFSIRPSSKYIDHKLLQNSCKSKILHALPLLFCLFYFTSNVMASQWQMDSKCEQALKSSNFRSGLKVIKEGTQSLQRMTAVLSDDQVDRAILVLWQGGVALNEVNKLSTLLQLNSMIAPQRRSDASELISINLEASASILKTVAEQIDTSILLFKNAGFREELRLVRGAIQDISASLISCKRG